MVPVRGAVFVYQPEKQRGSAQRQVTVVLVIVGEAVS